jgi:hypothetical protein
LRLPGREDLSSINIEHVPPYREKVLACSRGGTFKYFFPREEVGDVWRRLELHYGPIRKNDAMKTMEIESERFIFRATLLANPITVFRKRKCVDEDVAHFHTLVGYIEEDG